jgi:hypothetical protein
MTHEEVEIVRQHLCFKERDHVQADDTRRGGNGEAALILQRTETTYKLMTHEESKIMRQHLCFKKRDHVLSDGTRRGGNREAALVFQRTRPHTT